MTTQVFTEEKLREWQRSRFEVAKGILQREGELVPMVFALTTKAGMGAKPADVVEVPGGAVEDYDELPPDAAIEVCFPGQPSEGACFAYVYGSVLTDDQRARLDKGVAVIADVLGPPPEGAKMEAVIGQAMLDMLGLSREAVEVMMLRERLKEMHAFAVCVVRDIFYVETEAPDFKSARQERKKYARSLADEPLAREALMVISAQRGGEARAIRANYSRDVPKTGKVVAFGETEEKGAVGGTFARVFEGVETDA